MPAAIGFNASPDWSEVECVQRLVMRLRGDFPQAIGVRFVLGNCFRKQLSILGNMGPGFSVATGTHQAEAWAESLSAHPFTTQALYTAVKMTDL